MTTESFDQWAILELPGGQKLTGLIHERIVSGSGFVQIDIETAAQQVNTRLYPVSMVRCLTLISESDIKSIPLSEKINQPKYTELGNLLAQSTDDELIELLAVLTIENGRYRFSANKICGLVGGDRTLVLAKIRDIRLDSDAANIF